MKKTFESLGGQVMMFQGIGTDENDFSANISVIQGSGAEGFFWGGMYGQGGPLCVKMRQAGLNIPFVSGDGCFDHVSCCCHRVVPFTSESISVRDSLGRR